MSNYNFVAFIEARKPVFTNQMIYSDALDIDEARENALAKFDCLFPEARDRVIAKIMTLSEYKRYVDCGVNANFDMNN